jgi:hypothetical protein
MRGLCGRRDGAERPRPDTARPATGWAVSAAFLLAAAGIAWSQPAGLSAVNAVHASLQVPGRAAVLARIAGVDSDTPRGIALLQIIRVLHGAPTGSDPLRDQRVGRVRAYLADLSDFGTARSALPDGLAGPAQARSRATRRAVEGVFRSVGGDLDEQDGVYRFAVRDDEESRRRRQHLGAAGVDVAALEREFNAGATVALALPADEVPLPLDAAAWTRILPPGGAGAGSLLTALLDSRRASLFYCGLMSLDPETLAYVGAREELLDGLLDRDRPAILATLGRRIRVRGGRIDVPGGRAAVSAWEALLGERVTEPEPFMLELLDRDRGRAALLYDVIDHLDPPRQAFALGLRVPEGGARAQYLRALYDASLASLTGWDPEVRPFRRLPFDPVQLLAGTHVLPSGELPPPAGRQFWSAALSRSELSAEPPRLLALDAPGSSVDAGWLVQQVCAGNPKQREQSFRAWQFGQRAFRDLAPADLPHALIAVKGFIRFPMLILTLERLGVTDPAAYAGAVRHAQRLSEIGDRETATIALRQFQGALAVLERVRFSRVISAEAASQLVGTLTAVPLTPDGEYQGGVARWLETRFLPALAPLSESRAAAAGTTVSAEAALLAAMSGASSGAALPDVEWEGLPYRVDVGAAEFARAVRVRQKQGGHGLDAVLEFCRQSVRLRDSLTSPSDVAVRASALDSALETMLQRPPALPGERETGPDLRGLVSEALEELRKIRSPKDVSKVGRIAAPLERAGDALLAGVLASIAYAPHLGYPDGPELLAGDPSARHSFGLDERVREARLLNPWRLPQRSLGVAGGWRAAGSILGLDVGLAALALRRLETDGLPPQPGGNDIDRAALASAVVLSNPFAVSDAGRDALADAIRRGRARLSGVEAHPSALPGLVGAAGLNEWWRQVIAWAQVHEPERIAEYFSLADFVRIGEAETTPLPPLAAWGAAALDTEGCLCLRYPEAGVRDTLAGRMGTALVAEQFVDLALRVAESLADLGLPSQLSRSILALATQDVLEAYRPAYIDDWHAMAAAVRSLPDGRFIDYVDALTAGGPLVPDDRERRDDVRR